MRQKKRVALYVRVSTSEQSTDAQQAELKNFAAGRNWEVTKVYADHGISGTKASRPALDEMMKDCRRRKIDVVWVWKFDRFARSLRQLVTALEDFRRLGIDFVSATEGVDTTIPSGELIFQIFGAIAQFERALISERVKAGLSQAKRSGKHLGRPPKKRLDDGTIAMIRSERAKGASLRQLARRHGTSLWAVCQATAA